MTYRLVFNSYVDPDPVRNAELLEATTINARLFGEVIHLPGRPTFSEMFAAANSAVLSDDDISVIANSDVSFDESLLMAEEYLDGKTCWALSRQDMQRCDSQDAWVFCGRIQVPLANFTPGIPGCDNNLAYLLSKVGYRVLNPCISIRVRHHHASGIRRYIRGRDKVSGPYKQIHPQKLPVREIAGT